MVAKEMNVYKITDYELELITKILVLISNIHLFDLRTINKICCELMSSILVVKKPPNNYCTIFLYEMCQHQFPRTNNIYI